MNNRQFRIANGRQRTAQSDGRSLVFCLLASAFCCCAQAQFTLDWSTVNGGGGSTGGEYAVTGTIGQPDAGTMSGGQFTLDGGFWPGLAVSVPGGPTLFIQVAGSQVILSWSPATPGFALEIAEDLSTPLWTPVPGGNSSPTTLAFGAKNRFFRLTKP